MGNCSSGRSSEIAWEQCWQLHSQQIVTNPLYRLLDLEGGGDLIDCYEQKGIAAVRLMVAEQLPQFLYEAGLGTEFTGHQLIQHHHVPPSQAAAAVVSLEEEEEEEDDEEVVELPEPDAVVEEDGTAAAAAASESGASVHTAITTITDHEIVKPTQQQQQQQQQQREASASRHEPRKHLAHHHEPRKHQRHHHQHHRYQHYQQEHLWRSASRVYTSSSRHLTCWRLDRRGIFGETLLHLCFVCNTPVHKQLAKLLLCMFPNLSKDIFTGWEYFGQSALHMAIVQRDQELVRLLVRCGSDIRQRAVGDFFLPDDQRFASPAAVTNYSGNSYFGELPLAFAGCVGSAEIYDFLINQGADPNSCDMFGNTVLHMLVIHNQTEVYRLAVRHHKRPADAQVQNSLGLNPISLAAKLGRRDVFNEILDLNAAEMWRYSNITCKVYPLTGLDTISPTGRTDWDSAFMYIIHGTTDQHLDMLEEGVISQLLAEKWQKYARSKFLQRLLMLAIHLAIMSVAIYLRPRTALTPASSVVVVANGTAAAQQSPITVQEVFRYAFESITVLNCMATLIVHIAEVREQGIFDFVRGLGDAPPKASFLLASLLITLALPARLLQIAWPAQLQAFTMLEETLLIIGIPCVWAYLLFFAGGTQLNGTFVTMIYKMIVGDVLRFGIIYIIILICFAQVYYFLFQDIEQTSINSFRTPHATVMTLLQMTLGEFKYDEFNYTRYKELSKFVFAAFMVLVPIMLLNMLIAMMGNTYNLVNSRSRKEWISMWAKIVVILERSYSPEQLLAFKNDYAIPVPGRDTEVGLMTIYHTKKTLAKQRRTAINNWKRTFRRVLQLMRDHKQFGNESRFTFDGSEESLGTMRQQKSRLIGLQKTVVRTQRYARVLKSMESSALERTVAKMQMKPTPAAAALLEPSKELDKSIEEILDSVPPAALREEEEEEEEEEVEEEVERQTALGNSAFQILAAKDSPKTLSLRQMAAGRNRRPALVKQESSIRPALVKQESSIDEASPTESAGSAARLVDSQRATTERSDSASSSKTLISASSSQSPPAAGAAAAANRARKSRGTTASNAKR